MIAIDLNKKEVLDANPKEHNNLSSLIGQETQHCFSLLKKQKKSFQIFRKEL